MAWEAFHLQFQENISKAVKQKNESLIWKILLIDSP